MLYFWIRSLVARGSVDDSLSVLTDTSHLSLGNFSQVSLAFIWTHKRADLGALTMQLNIIQGMDEDVVHINCDISLID